MEDEWLTEKQQVTTYPLDGKIYDNGSIVKLEVRVY